MTKNYFGVWELTVTSNNGQPPILHGSKIKVDKSIWKALSCCIDKK